MSCCIAIVVDGAVKANYNCKIIIIFFPSMRVDRKIVLSVFVSSSYFLTCWDRESLKDITRSNKKETTNNGRLRMHFIAN